MEKLGEGREEGEERSLTRGGGALAHERGRSARSREGEERRSREGRGVGKSGRGKWWAVSDGGVFISDSARVSSDSAGGVFVLSARGRFVFGDFSDRSRGLVIALGVQRLFFLDLDPRKSIEH